MNEKDQVKRFQMDSTSLDLNCNNAGQRRANRQRPRASHHLNQWPTWSSHFNYLKIVLVCQLIYLSQISAQLPDDMQRELNQNLAEQARLQALRARHQQQLQTSRQSAASNGPAGAKAAAKPAAPPHDPNNYSYQQVSPPIQYSYYQPYGDLAKAQPASGASGGPTTTTTTGQNHAPVNFDMNSLNIDLPNLPMPQAQISNRAGGQPIGGSPQQPVQLVPQFTGAGGLPVLQPVAAAQQSPGTFAPVGVAGQQPQQGPPLTEADFKDITGGENYGAPGGGGSGGGGNDFGLGQSAATGGNGGAGGAGAGDANQNLGDQSANSGDNLDDAKLREFGMNDGQSDVAQQPKPQQRQDANPMAGMLSDMGGFNPMANQVGAAPQRRQQQSGGFDPFGAAGFGGLGSDDFGLGPSSQRRQARPAAGNEFDFASQPSSRPEQASGAGDAAQSALGGGAPGSLQSLLGNAFPGLAGGQAGSMGLDRLAQGNNAPESQLEGQQRSQRADDGAMDVADLGDRSDGFSGADLGGFEQPTPQMDQDFNYAAAAEQQPRSVPYPDGAPQLVGTLWALNQPQSLSQVRYNPLPDKGTYQDYPGYQSGGNDFGAVSRVVDGTPRARRAAPGRYGQPSPDALAPEYRRQLGPGQLFDYARDPAASPEFSASSSEFEADDFVD